MSRNTVVIEPGISVLHLIEGGSVVEYLATGNVVPAKDNEVLLAERVLLLEDLAGVWEDSAHRWKRQKEEAWTVAHSYRAKWNAAVDELRKLRQEIRDARS